MGEAKKIELRACPAKALNDFMRRHHYSGKIVQNSSIHVGVYWNGKLEGGMQFGPSTDKRKLLALVEGTGWDNFIELNRMAFSDVLPRNSESRAIGICMRLLKKLQPHFKWVISFADGTQCVDGIIYRASGFVLTQIKKNTSLWEINGQKIHRLSVTGRPTGNPKLLSEIANKNGQEVKAFDGSASMKRLKEMGAKPIEGFQLRYIYFLDPTWRKKLTVPEVPFSEIKARGASIYLGKRAVDA